jgi:uncharacterized protein YyaL (SSP411 family)
VIVRKKELYDGAVPSGNSLMAWNLYYSGVVYDNAEWRERAVKMGTGLRDVGEEISGIFWKLGDAYAINIQRNSRNCCTWRKFGFSD